MAKLTKKSIAAARKKVSPGQWQKRGLKTAWAIQKRGQKGGKRKSPAKAPAKRKSPARRGNPVASNNRKPKIGAAIQAFKGTQPLLSPVIDVAARGGANAESVSALRGKANAAYAGNVVMTAVNQAVDKKIAQGGALSRGSVTAWLAEGYAGLQASKEAKGSGRNAALGVNTKLAKTLNAYDPDRGELDFADADFRTYQGLKIGGGIARRLSNVGPFKRITAPAKKLLGEMGLAL